MSELLVSIVLLSACMQHVIFFVSVIAVSACVLSVDAGKSRSGKSSSGFQVLRDANDDVALYDSAAARLEADKSLPAVVTKAIVTMPPRPREDDESTSTTTAVAFPDAVLHWTVYAARRTKDFLVVFTNRKALRAHWADWGESAPWLQPAWTVFSTGTGGLLFYFLYRTLAHAFVGRV